MGLYDHLKQKYNPEGSELRTLQYRMLEEMVILDRICTENGLDYWLVGGSALGAVRHQGFIPWDDDMDIALMKKDYKKLKKILLEGKCYDSSKYVLQCHETEPDYINLFSKFREKKGDLLGSNPGRGGLYKYKGPGVDIFYVVKANKFCSHTGQFLHSSLLRWTCRIKKRTIRRIMTATMLFFSSVVRRCLSLFKLIHREKGELHYDIGEGFYNQTMYEYEIFPTKRIKFENVELKVPRDCNAYLTHVFGDYMQLPKEIMIHNSKLL